MRRTIEGFRSDDAGDWIAELSCAHRQHVRHQPPFHPRAWVTDAAGRAERVGSELDCPLCDRAEIPEGLEIVRTAGPFDADTLPRGLRADHRVADGMWARVRVLDGAVGFSMDTVPPISRRLEADDEQPIPPGVSHHLVVDGPMTVVVEFLSTNGTGHAGAPPARRGAMGSLDHEGLVGVQREVLESSRRRYGAAARVLFALLDVVYGRARTLSKFKVLELVARVPYQSWEQVAYIAITHVSDRPPKARRIFERVAEARAQQDNEQWHLLILEERIGRTNRRQGFVRYTLIPQLLAFVYYQVSWLLFVAHPRWSYRLNADFEDHASHEYMELVRDHPEWEHEPFVSTFRDDYAPLDTVADLFRQIAFDEREHRDASVARMDDARFR